MEISGGLGGGVMLALAAGLWLVYLVPSWLRRREYLATERNAVRLQQTLRVLAATAEVPDAVRAETNARSIAQHQAIAFKLAEMATKVEAAHLMMVNAARLKDSGERNDVVLAGNGVARVGAAPALREFARATGIGVAETFMDKGLLDYEDPHALGTVGLQSRDYTLAGFEDADVVITVGYDLVEHAPTNWNPKGDKKIICIDTAAVAALGKV